MEDLKSNILHNVTRKLLWITNEDEITSAKDLFSDFESSFASFIKTTRG